MLCNGVRSLHALSIMQGFVLHATYNCMVDSGASAMPSPRPLLCSRLSFVVDDVSCVAAVRDSSAVPLFVKLRLSSLCLPSSAVSVAVDGGAGDNNGSVVRTLKCHRSPLRWRYSGFIVARRPARCWALVPHYPLESSPSPPSSCGFVCIFVFMLACRTKPHPTVYRYLAPNKGKYNRWGRPAARSRLTVFSLSLPPTSATRASDGAAAVRRTQLRGEGGDDTRQ
jgi:hypothetical protein